MTTTLPKDVNIDLKELIKKTLQVYKQRASSATSLTMNIDDKYNAEHLLKMAKGLSLPEISTLLQASRYREEGLALVRSGNTIEGSIKINEAREIYRDKELSREAFLVAESFQSAAEAYTQYKRHEFNEASSSLFQALHSCNILHDSFAYNVEVRRIHLSRNIIRVMIFAGDQTKALRIACLLLRYIEGENNFWPFSDLQLSTPPDTIVIEERWILMNQVIGEIAMLITKRNPISPQLLVVCDEALCANLRNPESKFSRVYTWLDAQRSSVQGNVRQFLEKAITFYSEGPGNLPQAWRDLTKEFTALCQNISPEDMSVLQER